MTWGTVERRAIGSAASEGGKIVGYAAVYGPLSEDLGGFRERVAPGAFSRDLDSDKDVRALLDHDTSKVLGRRSAGTLKISSDSRGLKVEIAAPDTSYMRDLRELLDRGDVSQMSFGFIVRPGGETWAEEDGVRIRTLTDVDLVEVSVVTIPAYPDTTVAIRSMRAVEAEIRQRQLWLLRHRSIRHLLKGTEMKEEVRKLIEERAALTSKLEGLAKRELSPEEQAAWAELTAKVAELDAKVMAIEAELGLEEEPAEEAPVEEPPVEEQNSRILDDMKARLKVLEAKVVRRSKPLQPSAGPRFVRDLNDRRARTDRDMAIRGWALAPMGMVTDAHRAAAERCGFNLDQRTINLKLWDDYERRAQSTSTTAGGYLIPTGFIPEIEKAMTYYCPLRDYAKVLRTESGNPLQIPTVDDTAQVGERVNENAAMNAQDVTFGQKTLNAYLYNSKIVLVSLQLMQDSAIDPSSLFGGLLGERLGRIQATEFTTGTGSSQPEGVAYAAAAGVTAASATAIAVDDLIGLTHAVDRAYRPMGKLMMHDNILLAIRKLKDTTNQPIFTQSYMVGEPDRILGYPVVINNAMDSTIASTKRSVLFGDFSKFYIRDAMDLTIVRLDERYAEYGQVAFIAMLRSDSKLVNTAAVKRLTH